MIEALDNRGPLLHQALGFCVFISYVNDLNLVCFALVDSLHPRTGTITTHSRQRTTGGYLQLPAYLFCLSNTLELNYTIEGKSKTVSVQGQNSTKS